MTKTRMMMVLVGLAVAAASSCGGSVSLTGSESHFLDTCDGAGCGDGLSCICGVCTRTCSASIDCNDLAASSNCVEVADLPNGSTCGSSAIQPVCDVACSLDADCASAGADLRCIQGACRRLISSISPGTGGASTGSGGATSGSGGTPGAAGSSGYESCDAGVVKGGACTTEGSHCAKACGPDFVGYKVETCSAGVYVEGVCTFPPGTDYSCYQMASPLPACGITMAQAGVACSYPACTPCGPEYTDSMGALRTGACVCSSGIWSCATSTAWPPQTTFPGGPFCDATVAKAGACSSEGSVCYKTCGPKAIGFKPETCTQAVYVEGQCEFDPTLDYSCFTVPNPLVACGSTPVQSGSSCSVPDCQPCGPDYFDSVGNAKVGYCVCDAATGRWSCASAASWPPQQ